MTYSLAEVNLAIKATRLRFFRSVLLSTIVGSVALYYISHNSTEDMTMPGSLFFGFLVGFATAGLVLPRGFLKILLKPKVL